MTNSHKVFPGGSPDTGLNEATLIWFSQRGDPDAFASLYDTYRHGIHRYILIRVADPELAEDLTSLVFLKAWENMNTFRIGRSLFAAWLYRIAHNAVIDHSAPLKLCSPLKMLLHCSSAMQMKLTENLTARSLHKN